MIVAHPDDELLWGWKELEREGGWTIICLTNGNVLQRACAFSAVTGLVQAKGFMYNYLDDPTHLSWDADTQRNIKDDLRDHLRSSEITRIVTHGPDGEYGHYHHRMVSKLVTDTCRTLHKLNRLEYFDFDLSHVIPHSQLFTKCLSQYFSAKDINTDETIKGHLALSRMVTTIPHGAETGTVNVHQYYPSWFRKCGIIAQPLDHLG